MCREVSSLSWLPDEAFSSTFVRMELANVTLNLASSKCETYTRRNTFWRTLRMKVNCALMLIEECHRKMLFVIFQFKIQYLRLNIIDWIGRRFTNYPYMLSVTVVR